MLKQKQMQRVPLVDVHQRQVAPGLAPATQAATPAAPQPLVAGARVTLPPRPPSMAQVSRQAAVLQRATNGRPARAGGALLQMQRQYGNRYVQQVVAHATGAAGRQPNLALGPTQRQTPSAPDENRTGLPDALKAGLEQLSGLDLSGVRVHYNSAKPAHLNALAYAQGQVIEVGPGQARHLPHEGWHVVQQMQGRVLPTLQAKGMEINDDESLEREADEMGRAASEGDNPIDPIQQKEGMSQNSIIIQRKIGFEFETAVAIKTVDSSFKVPYGVQLYEAKEQRWQIKSDNSKIEFVTKEVNDNEQGREIVGQVMDEVTSWAKNMESTITNGKNGKLSDVQPSCGEAKKYKNEDVVLDTDGLNLTKVTAAPQASGGVTLDKIPALIDQLIKVKLNHLRNSKTFKPQFELPKEPDYSKMEEEEKKPADQFTASVIDLLVKQGYDTNDTNDISYSVGVQSLLTVVYLTTAKNAVERFIREEVDTKTEGKDIEEFRNEIGICPSEFRAQTPNLQGLLTLVMSYLYGGDANKKAVPYTKAIATLMSRTNFYALHKLLTTTEQKFFEPKLVLYIAGLEDGPLFTGGFMNGDSTETGPTRVEWIESIIEGTKLPGSEEMVKFDRLSQGSKTPEALNSASLGAFSEPDTNIYTKEKNLAVLEIRSMPKNQAIDDWKQTALTVFDLFMKLNKPDEVPASAV